MMPLQSYQKANFLIYSVLTLVAIAYIFACNMAKAQDADPDTWRLKEPVGGVLESCQVTATPQLAAFAPASRVFPASAPPYGFEHPFTIGSMIAGIQGAVELTASCSNSAGEGAPATPASASFPVVVPESPGLLE